MTEFKDCRIEPDKDARIAELEKWAKFGMAVLDEMQEGYQDLDAEWVQTSAVECGLLEAVTVTEPCDPDQCVCAEAGDFPVECYQRTKAGNISL